MTPDEAYQTLVKRMTGDAADPIARAAWKALDELLKGNAELPEAWARLTLNQAADRMKRDPQRFANLVSQGYAPPADGHDGGGRAWWHPVTVDDFQANGWTKPRDPAVPPPRNASRDRWAEWAQRRGATVRDWYRRDQIISLCDSNGWLK